MRRRRARRSATRKFSTPRPRSAPAASAANRPAPRASPAPSCSRDQGDHRADERVVCILTGHQLKDPTATVAYHTTDQEQFNKVLGSRGVRRASFANRAVAVPNDRERTGRNHRRTQFNCIMLIASHDNHPNRHSRCRRPHGQAARAPSAALIPNSKIVAAVDWEQHPDIGKDAGLLAGVERLGRAADGRAPRRSASRDRLLGARRRRVASSMRASAARCRW